MKTLFGRVVFGVGGAVYCWEDVVLGAELRGEWTPVRERVRQCLACLERAEEDDDPLSETDIQTAANEFRYARNLVSAQEMEDWLNRWDLTAEGWMNHIRCSLLRDLWSDELPEIVSIHPVSDEAIEGRVKWEAVFSGDLARFAYELAGRAAVFEKQRGDPAWADPGCTAGTTDASKVLADGRKLGFSQLSEEALREKIDRLARIERSFWQYRMRALTPGAVETSIRAQQTDWTRVDCFSVSFPEEDMAREAALAVLADGRPLTEVAADAKTDVHRARFFIEDLEPTVRDRLLSAQRGELVGPFEIGGEFGLYLLLDKAAPTKDDVDVVRRAEETLWKRLVAQEIDDSVKWHERL